MLNRSGIVSTRSTPARRTAASKTASDPARAPVCDAAALAPASCRPALTTMTCFDRAAARAALINLRHVADRFHVQHDAGRIRIVAEVIDQVGEIDVEHGADRDEAGKADVASPGPSRGWTCKSPPIDSAGRLGPAWPCDDAKLALNPLAGWMMPRQLGPTMRILPWAMSRICFSSARALGAEFGKPGRDDDRRRHAAGDALLDGGGHGGGRRGDDGEIDRVRGLQQRRIAINAVHRLAFRIDGIDDAAERILQQVAHEDAADAARRGAGADDRHGCGPEERIERIGAIWPIHHGITFICVARSQTTLTPAFGM